MRKLNTAINKKINEILPDVPVYPAIADADAAMPYVVYTDESFTVDRTKDGIFSQIHNVTIDIWTEKFDEGDEMADILLANMEYVISPGIESYITSGNWGYEDGSYRQTLNFEIEVDV